MDNNLSIYIQEREINMQQKKSSQMTLRAVQKRKNYSFVPRIKALDTSRPEYLNNALKYRQKSIRKITTKTRITRSYKRITSLIQAKQARLIRMNKLQEQKAEKKSDSLKESQIDPLSQKSIEKAEKKTKKNKARGNLRKSKTIQPKQKGLKKKYPNIQHFEREKAIKNREEVIKKSEEPMQKKQGQPIRRKRGRPRKLQVMEIIKKDERVVEEPYIQALKKALQILKVNCWTSLFKNLHNIQAYLEDSKKYGSLNIEYLPSKLEMMDQARELLQQMKTMQ